MDAKFLNFQPVELSLREKHAEYFMKTPRRAADYTFTNLWGWAEVYGMEWVEAHGLLWLRQSLRGGMTLSRLWCPMGDWNAADWDAIVAQTPAGTCWDRVPLELATPLLERFPERIRMEETTEQWEYLYESQTLATLAGNKLHKKRNHVNGYIKAYGEDYRELTLADIDAVLALQHDWCRWRECEKSPALMAESEVTLRVLNHWADLPALMAGALYVDNLMVAFTVAEPLDNDTLVIHFEKGRPEYRGVYQAINACFAKNRAPDFRLLNREQDAGEEGLRQAKESYYPVDYLHKNRLCFK